MANWGFAPFAVNAYDNPETIRIRKYVTGAPFVLRGAGGASGRIPERPFGRRERPRFTVEERGRSEGQSVRRVLRRYN
jgi:hypothetical protein